MLYGVTPMERNHVTVSAFPRRDRRFGTGQRANDWDAIVFTYEFRTVRGDRGRKFAPLKFYMASTHGAGGCFGIVCLAYFEKIALATHRLDMPATLPLESLAATDQSVSSGVALATSAFTVARIAASRTPVFVFYNSRSVGRAIYGYVGGAVLSQDRAISDSPILVQQWHHCPLCTTRVASGALMRPHWAAMVLFAGEYRPCPPTLMEMIDVGRQRLDPPMLRSSPSETHRATKHSGVTHRRSLKASCLRRVKRLVLRRVPRCFPTGSISKWIITQLGSTGDSRDVREGSSVAVLRELASSGHNSHWPCARAEGTPRLYSTEAPATILPSMLRVLAPPPCEVLNAASFVLSKLRPSYIPTLTEEGLPEALEPNEICAGATNRVCTHLVDAVGPIPRSMPSSPENFVNDVLSAEGLKYRPEIVHKLKERLGQMVGEGWRCSTTNNERERTDSYLRLRTKWVP